MPRILVLEREPGPLTTLAAEGEDIAAVPDLDGCLAALQQVGRPELVAIGDWPQPLTAARHVRRASPVGIALLVPEPRLHMARTRLALAPEITNAVVLADDLDPARLRTTLDEAAMAASRRGQLRRALDTINRDVLGASRPPVPVPTTGVSEQYLAALVDHAPDVILSVDPQGLVVTLNGSGERLLRTTSQAAEGRTLEQLLPAEEPDEVGQLLATATSEGRQTRRELCIQRGDEDALLLSVTAAPMLDPAGTLLGHVVIGRDITRERHSEERLRQLQQAESLATLAGGVAHDFNNLLVGVQGWASIARTSPGDVALVDQALGQILEASARAAELARSMLAYSGRGRIELTSVDLNDLITGMTRLLRSSVSPKTRLEVDLEPATPEIRADATQLRQVLMNLVINAAEAIGDAAGRIIVRSGQTDVGRGQTLGHASAAVPAGRYIAIDVEDDGPGITGDVLERIFDPFFSTKFAGRGLGLAASAGIVAAHDGTIEVDSTPGEGARFRVLLPVGGKR